MFHRALAFLPFLFAAEASLAAPPLVTMTSVVQTGTLAQEAIEVESVTGQMFLVSLVGSASPGQFTVQVHGEAGRLPIAGGLVQLSDPQRTAGLLAAYFDRSDSLFAVLLTHIRGEQAEIVLQQLSRNDGATVLGPQVLSAGFRVVELLGRKSTPSRGLLAITQTNFGPGSFYDRRVKIVDESTGATVSVSESSLGGTLELFKTSKGDLKVLSAGPEGLKILDAASGAVTDVLGQAESHVLFDLETANGAERAVISTTAAGVEVRKISAVLQNVSSSAVVLPPGTQLSSPAGISSSQRFGFTINAQNTIVRIVDLLNGQVVGAPLAVPSHGGPNFRAEHSHSVALVFEDRGQLIAVLDRPTQPHSFFNGNTLTYMKVATGEVLRIREETDARILPTIFNAIDGRTLVVEREQYLWYEYVGVRIVDALSGQVVVNHVDLEGIGFPFRSESGENILLTVQSNPNFRDGFVCILSLDSSVRSCIADPLVNGLVRYRQGMIKIEDGLISLPLIDAQAEGLGRAGGVARFHIK